jgi:hypothetical protein
MQGVYQGNGGGPTIWAVVSSPILQIMKKEGFGTFFKASITNGIVQIIGMPLLTIPTWFRQVKTAPDLAWTY